jgi:hypothetical protein
LDVVNDNLQSLGREWYRAEFMRSYSKATKKEKSMSKSCTGGKHGQAAASKKERGGWR